MQMNINHCRVWLFYNEMGAVAQCPNNWGVGSAFHPKKIHILWVIFIQGRKDKILAAWLGLGWAAIWLMSISLEPHFSQMNLRWGCVTSGFWSWESLFNMKSCNLCWKMNYCFENFKFKFNSFSLTFSVDRHDHGYRLQRWYVTIPSLDQWWPTIEKPSSSMVGWPKTIEKPSFSMVASDHSIQWWWCLWKPLQIFNGSKNWKRIMGSLF